tara:strand:- start:271 stop:447 length:177 start_codon:yes stop_codon:yes gene_type:complete
MDAKCANCELVANYDVSSGVVKCKSCGFKASYDKYIELMTGRIDSKASSYVEKENYKA